MSEKHLKLTAAQREQLLLDSADDIMEKAASAAPAMADFIKDESSRMEDRPEVAPDEEVEEVAPTSRAQWGTSPSVRNQLTERPDTVRWVEPETKVLDLSDDLQLAEYNRIQQAAAHTTSPTLAISDCERQTHNGGWTALVTFYKVQYQQL